MLINKVEQVTEPLMEGLEEGGDGFANHLANNSNIFEIEKHLPSQVKLIHQSKQAQGLNDHLRKF